MTTGTTKTIKGKDQQQEEFRLSQATQAGGDAQPNGVPRLPASNRTELQQWISLQLTADIYLPPPLQPPPPPCNPPPPTRETVTSMFF